jgi:hypothetical protein
VSNLQTKFTTVSRAGKLGTGESLQVTHLIMIMGWTDTWAEDPTLGFPSDMERVCAKKMKQPISRPGQ